METKKSPEHKVRIKIGLIFVVVILYFAGLSIYSNFLKKNMDDRKVEMDNSYTILSKSNQLIVSIQQAQDVLNSYLVSPQQKLQLRYDSISSDISRQILEIENIKHDENQISLLQDIDSLLQEKNKMVRRLSGLFRSQNPLAELDERINKYDETIKDTVIVTINTDTTKIEKPQKGFWQRFKNLVNPKNEPDTTLLITHTELESWSTSRVDTSMYVDLKNITETASKTYNTRIQGIEREVRELLFAEQKISLHISQLTNEFYNETILFAWMGMENNEKLNQRIFDFAIIVGALSIFIILIITFLIINDLNKGQKARIDLAKEKQFTEELIESRHKLLLSVSHDVKTPLSSMMGYMEIWDAEETDVEKRKQLQSARNSGAHILNMLTNLLDFSRLQQKSVSLNNSHFNLIDLADEIIQMFRPLTEEKALNLKFENLAPSPLYVETDRMLLKQIITNVVSNAVKYTSKGEIILTLQYDDQLVISVTDSGIGMDASEVSEIFKPFSRLQNNSSAEGSGFGMYVTKGLTDLLHGKIEVASEKDKGTCVTLRLPLHRVPEKTVREESPPPPTKERRYNSILLFEDDPSLGKMIKEYLIRNGFKVKLCDNPQDVNGFLRVISQFDIVFTDMQMIKITGMDILREIRKTNEQIPVWLMTANDDFTLSKAISDGFSGLLRKPIRMEGLLETVFGNKDSKNKDRENKSTENKETENRKTENRKTENKETENRKTENKETENRDMEREYHQAESTTRSADLKKMDAFPQLVALFGDDTQTIREILREFVQTSQQDMVLLREYVKTGSFTDAQQLCHKIYPFLYQLEAVNPDSTIRKMDLLRGEDETAFPDWKESLSKNIQEIEEFTEMIKEKWL